MPLQPITEIQTAGSERAAQFEKLRYAFKLRVISTYLTFINERSQTNRMDQVAAWDDRLFEAELRPIVQGVCSQGDPLCMDPEELAHLLAATGKAFMVSSQSVEELQGFVDRMLKVLLASLEAST